ncbi:MAG: ribonuclease Z [Cytophagales bacterium]
MIFKVLGAGSATPVLGRYPSAFALTLENETFLIDCGEGTQWRMLEYGVKHSKINQIFISHLHGDHFLGLVGLISTLNSLGRKQELTVFAPIGLKEILSVQFKYQGTRLEYGLIINELDANTIIRIAENKKIEIFAFPLVHRIETYGFLFKEKPKERNLIRGKLPENILLLHIHTLKNGLDVIDENGNIIYKADEFTLPLEKGKSFAYCSDTAYSETLLPFIADVDLLYHETTFLEEKEQRATETYHSTAMQAATIAQKANVKQMVIGHFSSRYKDVEPFLSESTSIFPNITLAYGGLEIHF